jgi:type I restriction enzyme S subunit
VLRPDRNQVLDDWLVFYLNQADLNEFVSGLTVPKLNQGSLRGISIPLPKIAQQQLIVERLSELEASTSHLAELHAAKVRAYEALGASLLSQAFSGNLGKAV